MENAEVKFLTVGEAWQELCETPDITSPEEYPDHALITMEQLGDFIERANPAPSFQSRVKPWMLACFGDAILADQTERTHRFIEEALELVQACGCSQSEAHQLVDYVYGRPIGEPHQEVGGVMVTLAALCLTNEIDMHVAAETELARVWTKVEAIRAKHAAKPKHSPLPGPSAFVSMPAQLPMLYPDDYSIVAPYPLKAGTITTKKIAIGQAYVDADKIKLCVAPKQEDQSWLEIFAIIEALAKKVGNPKSGKSASIRSDDARKLIGTIFRLYAKGLSDATIPAAASVAEPEAAASTSLLPNSGCGATISPTHNADLHNRANLSPECHEAPEGAADA